MSIEVQLFLLRLLIGVYVGMIFCAISVLITLYRDLREGKKGRNE